jgi:TonB family protein
LRDFKPCPFAALLVCILSAAHLGAQQFDPRERFEVPDRVRLSGHVLSSLMRNQVLPSYPAEARNKGIQGEVVLMLYVEKDGRVSNVGVVSGDPLLTASSLQAAKRLRFRSYYLDDQAVPTEGQIIYSYAIVPGKGTTVILLPRLSSQMSSDLHLRDASKARR